VHKKVKSFLSHKAQRAALISVSVALSLCCQTINMWLVLCVECLYMPQLLLVPSYTVWWQRHTDVSYLPKFVIWQHSGRELNSQLSICESNALTTRLPSHSMTGTAGIKSLSTSMTADLRDLCEKCIREMTVENVTVSNWYEVTEELLWTWKRWTWTYARQPRRHRQPFLKANSDHVNNNTTVMLVNCR